MFLFLVLYKTVYSAFAPTILCFGQPVMLLGIKLQSVNTKFLSLLSQAAACDGNIYTIDHTKPIALPGTLPL